MPGVNSAWSIFRFVNRDFLVCCIGQYPLQQRLMWYHTAPFLTGSRLCLKQTQCSYCRNTDRAEERHLDHFIFPKLTNEGKSGVEPFVAQRQHTKRDGLLPREKAANLKWLGCGGLLP